MIRTLPLIAQADAALTEAGARTTYTFSRFSEFSDQRWKYLVLILAVAAILFYVWRVYRRDGAEIRSFYSWLLTALRVVALLAILFFFLGLEKRTEREVVRNSRVLILVDTSQSMGLHDSDSSAVPATPTRIDQVINVLEEGKLLKDLRKIHDVLVVKFDRDSQRVASLEKFPAAGILANNRSAAQDDPARNEKQAETPPDELTDEAKAELQEQAAIDWKKDLLPQGAETRLGSALKKLIDEERSTPVSAVVVVTDGAQNSGLNPQSAVELAKKTEIPVYTVGLGIRKQPVNVRIGDFIAPSRAYPKDSFNVTGYIQGQGLAGRNVTVELHSRDAADKNGIGILEKSQRVTLGPDGEIVPIKFELTPDIPGRRTYRLSVESLKDDFNQKDNVQEVDIEIVDRDTRVLLFASGPTREYQFLSTQLRRDEDIVSDVFLQSVQPDRINQISQDASTVLAEFPSTKEELYEYDVIVAFDPDWNSLSQDQIGLVESWVAEEAGGLIVIAGPIFTSDWVRLEEMSKIRSLYPVEFNRHATSLYDSEYGSKTPWPIQFTRAGLEAEFLWIEDNASASQGAWNDFPGIYGFYAVKRAKPGATVYASFSESDSGSPDDPPVYMASHLYGSGRVFYIGSGEMWRLRSEDPVYFEKFYTKLTRHVSQGRLLRGSSRGVLLVERDRYLLGDTVIAKAQLSNTQHEPLLLPSVTMQLTRPDSTTQAVTLLPDATRAGMYAGQFTVLQEGAFRLDLPVPDTLDEQLTRRIQVRVPDLERENPQRNDTLLNEIAASTGGIYYVGLDPVVHGGDNLKPLVQNLRNRKETTIIAGAPDQQFKEDMFWWLMIIICGALFLEWLLRRLLKLA